MTVISIRAQIPRDPRSKGILLAITGALLMSLDPMFVRLSGTGGFNTVFLFGLFTMISIPILIQLTDQRGLIGNLKASGWPVLFSGLLMLGSATTLILSIKNTSVSNTFFIMSSAPAFAAVFSWFFLGEKTNKSTWFAIIAAIGGIAIVVFGSLESGHTFGDVLALFAVTCVSLNQTLLRKYKNVSRMATVGMGGFLLAVVMFFLAEPSTFSLNTWLIMGVMGLFSAPLGRVMSQTSTRYITAPEVGVITLVEAVIAPFWAFCLFREIPAITTVVGGTVIFSTILIYIISTGKQDQCVQRIM